MIDKFYDQVVVKTKYNNNNGSGILITTENRDCSYLITAWHCINREENPNLNLFEMYRQSDGNIARMTVNAQEILVIKEKDVVVIRLDVLLDIPLYRSTTLSVGEEVIIPGFPQVMQNSPSVMFRYPLRASIVSLPGDNIIQLNSERSMTTFSQNAVENMSGFSGSGIFKILDNEVFLCGIITELGSVDGAFDAICGVSSDCIQNILLQNGWKQLCDIGVCSFNIFKDSVIDIFEEPMNRICSVQMPNIKKNIRPSEIIKRCGKKLVWPYSDSNLQCKEIWEGWLLYLIFRSIESQENLKDENYYIVNNTNGNRRIKLIYVTNKTKLSDFLKDYLQNAYKDINEGDFLIIKTNRLPAVMMLQSSQINKVVTDISNAICVEQEIRIDDVKCNTKSLSLIHIRKMVDELSIVLEEINDQISDLELEKRLGKRIGEMLHEF